MTVLKRCAAVGATLALGLSLAACGGGGGADVKTGASVEEFCAGYNGDDLPQPDLAPDATPDEQATALLELLQEQAANVEEVGVPDDMPDDAQEGFELTIGQVGDLDKDQVTELMESESDNFFELEGEDQAKVDALDEYVAENC